jgi:hypothetical protein
MRREMVVFFASSFTFLSRLACFLAYFAFLSYLLFLSFFFFTNDDDASDSEPLSLLSD